MEKALHMGMHALALQRTVKPCLQGMAATPRYEQKTLFSNTSIFVFFFFFICPITGSVSIAVLHLDAGCVVAKGAERIKAGHARDQVSWVVSRLIVRGEGEMP